MVPFSASSRSKTTKLDLDIVSSQGDYSFVWDVEDEAPIQASSLRAILLVVPDAACEQYQYTEQCYKGDE